MSRGRADGLLTRENRPRENRPRDIVLEEGLRGDGTRAKG